jgi:exopolyphosphatase / guanosine-5'-triphosphate,3'-diphosphate pyrophosphatase
MIQERIGIIDLGSNSSRLVIYEIQDNGAFRPILRIKRDIRLATYLGSDGRISDEGIARAVACIQLFHRVGVLHDVTDWIPVATATLRQAENGQWVVSLLHRTSGLQFRVLEGIEEARYGYLGVVNTLDIDDALIFDIGGASTEIMEVRHRRLLNSASLPYGALNLTAQFHDLPPRAHGDACYQFISDKLREVSWLQQCTRFPLIGIGGTARALSKWDSEVTNAERTPIHGYELKRKNLLSYYTQLKSMTVSQRKKIRSLSKSRAEMILAGFATIVALSDTLSSDDITVSANGLREGLFYEHLLGSDAVTTSPLETSVNNLQKLFGVNTRVAALIEDAAIDLFDTLQPIHELGEYERKLLQVAIRLENTGCYINSDRYKKHAAYLAEFSHLYGLRHSQVKDLARLLVGKGDKSLRQLGVLIRLSKLLVLQMGVNAGDLICRVEDNRIAVGRCATIDGLAPRSADLNIAEDFAELFDKPLAFFAIDRI